MPITQQRMLAVIASGNAWRAAFEAAERDIKFLISFREKEDITEAELLSRLRTVVLENTPPLASVENLSTESRYFEKYSHRNTMARQRSSRYRFNEGRPPRSTAPDKPNTDAKTPSKARHAPERSLEAPVAGATQMDIKRQIAREEYELLKSKNPTLADANLALPEDFNVEDL